ncbi:TetR/AcrR family transcriptional regulator [Bhargavaea cecembensis]|uniref:TetR/AcrR family transcriptional regulator n=1 Tax=Bhargavaea cecembensis TaxID=394098 RepID=UPI00058FDF85|nr:TetR/AcrR family transcriptional regulator [Bhargavaea cecembensis]
MKNKQLQMSRMWKYFVEATVEIIEEEGISKVTIRKVADRAGYNSATIYNYFSELSHLVFFASMRLLRDYVEDVSQYVKKADTPLEQYVLAWECFCRHSFKSPELFHAVFMMDLGDQPERLMERYYETYPADLLDVPEAIQPSLFERNVMKRGRSLLVHAVEAGQVPEEKLTGINEMTNLIWQGMMSAVLNNRLEYDIETAEERTIGYIKEVIRESTKG